MNSAQRTRYLMLVVVMLVAVGVFVFGRKQPQQLLGRWSGGADEKPLVLRKDMALSIGDPAAGENQRFVPIPDRAVPIQWDQVEAASRTMTRTVPSVLPSMVSARDPDRLQNPIPDPGRWRDQSDVRSPAASAEPMKLKYHRIVEGETLRDIAARYLGSPDRSMELFYANRALLPHPDVLPLGARIVIPDPRAPLRSATQIESQVSPTPTSSTPPTVAPPTRYVPVESPWRSQTGVMK
jgi:hypothetical protein